jgi:hypothetical protein
MRAIDGVKAIVRPRLVHHAHQGAVDDGRAAPGLRHEQSGHLPAL